MTDHEHRDQEQQMELLGCRDHLTEVRDCLRRLTAETPNLELAQCLANVEAARSWLKNYGSDASWKD